MIRIRPVLILATASMLSLGCASASAPGASNAPGASAPSIPSEPASEQASAPTDAGPSPEAPSDIPHGATRSTAEPAASADPSPARLRDETPALKALDQPVETALEWSDLTRMARDHQRRGELAEAELRLEQASMLVADLAPTDARRRTVFGTRARFAELLAYEGELDGADLLADQLIDEAEREPALGDAALISLALSVADRRTAADQLDDESGTAREYHSQLRILQVALTTAQAGTINRERLVLATRVANLAYLEGELSVARNAIDQALADAQTLAPSDRAQIAELSLLRARIATEQGDFDEAIVDATRANRIAAQLGADASRLGLGEAILAEAMAANGDQDQALEIARAARDRLDSAVALENHSQRAILTALARIEAARGHPARATRYYNEALAIPFEDSAADRHLASSILEERALLSAGLVPTPEPNIAGPSTPSERDVSAQPRP